MAGKVFNLLLFISLAFFGQSPFQVFAENGTTDADTFSEDSNIPVFVRSKFNLRIWSTTDVTTVEQSGNQTASTTTAGENGKLNDGITTTELPTTQVPTEITTAKRKQRKLSSSGCGERIGNSVPWIAILEHTNPKGGGRKKTLSKGVLIDDRHVLTTISSIHNSYPFWVVTGIRLGDFPTLPFFEGGGRSTNERKSDVLSIPVKNVFLHERKDIAVIRLAERVNATEKIRPVCLPTNDRFNYTELHVHLCFKDKYEFGRMNTSSKLVSVTSLAQKDCQILFRRHQAELGPKEFCVWDETGDDCTGDLGGPLVTTLGGRFHVVGLNSYALAKSKIGSEGLPGVYVRVGSFNKWIQAVLKTEFDDS
ncbi:CLIP domain-containing serine protease B4-like [Toxorhynchites rutilus septentrionalis]|uniref:CLIP domain-containing serine protease B4-like n=1 Tax=Toxorhynchites rutilus septentrionalis TaxID=329112 RepID=UPI002479DA72|nr:CLIP domain-containing serine protease B4-like [Toxorhynchites rutilus septentrionalis]